MGRPPGGLVLGEKRKVRRRRFCAALAAVTAGVTLAACGRAGKPPPRAPSAATAPRPATGATEEGVASWYGNPYHGRATTSGEIYNMEEMTAAHRTLPFGARVAVENLANGRRVEVRINDRGPFVENRVIDLSRAAAREIQMIGPGTAPVRLRVIRLPEPAPGYFAVQVGSFRSRGNAERLRRRLAGEHGAASIENHPSPRGRFYRVLAGRESGLAGAASLARKLRAQGFTPFIVRVEEKAARG